MLSYLFLEGAALLTGDRFADDQSQISKRYTNLARLSLMAILLRRHMLTGDPTLTLFWFKMAAVVSSASAGRYTTIISLYLAQHYCVYPAEKAETGLYNCFSRLPGSKNCLANDRVSPPNSRSAKCMFSIARERPSTSSRSASSWNGVVPFRTSMTVVISGRTSPAKISLPAGAYPPSLSLLLTLVACSPGSRRRTSNLWSQLSRPLCASMTLWRLGCLRRFPSWRRLLSKPNYTWISSRPSVKKRDSCFYHCLARRGRCAAVVAWLDWEAVTCVVGGAWAVPQRAKCCSSCADLSARHRQTSHRPLAQHCLQTEFTAARRELQLKQVGARGVNLR